MIGTSTVFIFGLMYLNADHIFRDDEVGGDEDGEVAGKRALTEP